MDIPAPLGTEALAVFDGIATVYWTNAGGHTIDIRSDQNWVAHYGHLNDVAIRNGAQVAAGQVIGHTGNSGTLSNGPHLHFAVGTYITGDVGQGTILPCDWLAGAGNDPIAATGAAVARLPWKLIGLGVAALLLVDEL